MEALILWEIAGFYTKKVYKRTGVLKQSLSKLRIKALSYRWIPKNGPNNGGILETWHVDDAP
jgi:hypothetical protein